MASRRAVESYWIRWTRCKGRRNILLAFPASWTFKFWLITSRSLIFSLAFSFSLQYAGWNGGNPTNLLDFFFCFFQRASKSAFFLKLARFDHSSHLWQKRKERSKASEQAFQHLCIALGHRSFASYLPFFSCLFFDLALTQIFTQT
jgi:hypothetical protein